MFTEAELRTEIEKLTGEKIDLQKIIKTSRDGRVVMDARDRMDYVLARIKFLNGKLEAFKLMRGVNRSF